MYNQNLEYFLSTKTDSKSRKNHIFNSIEFFIISAMLLFLGYYTYNINFINIQNGPIVFFNFLPYFLIILSIIVLIFGVRNLFYHETIRLDSNGLTATKGRKKFYASWNQIIEIKSTNSFVISGVFSGGIPLIRSMPCIIISTTNSKFKIKTINFDIVHLKDLMIRFLDFSNRYQINIIDGIDLLPDQQGFEKSKKLGKNARIKEFRILLKIGGIMFVLSLIMLPIMFIFNLFESDIWFVTFVILLFFGILLMIAGGCGLSEEKNKKN